MCFQPGGGRTYCPTADAAPPRNRSVAACTMPASAAAPSGAAVAAASASTAAPSGAAAAAALVASCPHAAAPSSPRAGRMEAQIPRARSRAWKASTSARAGRRKWAGAAE
eukprot:scaffold97248_cov63-Phaeocystis_antarctica.AAC.5